jgi:hypothetical protein
MAGLVAEVLAANEGQRRSGMALAGEVREAPGGRRRSGPRGAQT